MCGVHAKERLNPALAGWVMMCASGQSILVSLIFLLSPDVLKTWRAWISGTTAESSYYTANATVARRGSSEFSTARLRNAVQHSVVAATEESVQITEEGTKTTIDIQKLDIVEETLDS